jgi:hypothetical protein
MTKAESYAGTTCPYHPKLYCQLTFAVVPAPILLVSSCGFIPSYSFTIILMRFQKEAELDTYVQFIMVTCKFEFNLKNSLHDQTRNVFQD